MTPNYTYAASVKQVVDGDTIDLTIDLGLRVLLSARIRLMGIDTPEVSTEKGRQVRDIVRSLLPAYTPVLVSTFKNPEDKYGRWLGVITMQDKTVLNDLLVREGHAVAYDGGKKA